MRSDPTLRKRYPSMSIVTGGNLLFELDPANYGSPQAGIAELGYIDKAARGFYHFHSGDLFIPGVPLWALDPSHETPLLTTWGHAFLTPANVFGPQKIPPFISMPVQPVVGVGGQIHGNIIFQPITPVGIPNLGGIP